MRYLHAPLRHVRSNVVAYLALVVAIGGGGSYALAASSSNGTIAVCVDKGSGVMHLAKHPRCGHGQSRIGLSSALDRPTVSAWAERLRWQRDQRLGSCRSRHAGAGVYDVTSPPRAAACASTTRQWSASTTASRRGAGGAGAFPWRGPSQPSSAGETFTVYTGVVVTGRSSRRTSRSTSPTRADAQPGGVDDTQRD